MSWSFGNDENPLHFREQATKVTFLLKSLERKKKDTKKIGSILYFAFLEGESPLLPNSLLSQSQHGTPACLHSMEHPPVFSHTSLKNRGHGTLSRERIHLANIGFFIFFPFFFLFVMRRKKEKQPERRETPVAEFRAQVVMNTDVCCSLQTKKYCIHLGVSGMWWGEYQPNQPFIIKGLNSIKILRKLNSFLKCLKTYSLYEILKKNFHISPGFRKSSVWR